MWAWQMGVPLSWSMLLQDDADEAFSFFLLGMSDASSANFCLAASSANSLSGEKTKWRI